MQRIAYSQVLARAAQRTSEETNPSVQLAATLNSLINQWAQVWWDEIFWAEWTVFEQRQFRDTWLVGATYAAGVAGAPVEVYYAPADTYYQSLHAGNIGNAPATLSGGVYVENSAHWAKSQGSYSSSTWAASTVYAVGVIVLNPNDQSYYQCITAHTSTSTFDASKFGLLTNFRRNISYTQTGKTVIGATRRAWDADPTINSDAAPIKHTDSTYGALIWGSASRPWIEFRLQAPSWSGTVWSTSVAYNVGDQVYYSTLGDWYSCIQANTAQAPSLSAYWTRIDFPYVLRDCVPQAAYADWLRGEGQNQKADRELEIALTLLQREIRLATNQRNQLRTLNVIRQ